MYQEFKQWFKKSPFHPYYCKLRGWSPNLTVRFDKAHTWAFNAGNTFTGNPKWLFVYINKYHKEIDAYWLCDKEETVEYIRSLGYKAYGYKTSDGIAMQRKTGVYVVEQVKEYIQPRMMNVKYLNLFHGVGCKPIERYVNKYDFGYLNERIIKKYIKYNEFYMKNMLFLVTSPLMEDHFKRNCGLRDFQIIRGGYPRCIYQKYFDRIATFDHDILKQKGLPADTKIAAYVPTYRDNPNVDFWEEAMPDFPRLIKKLEEQNLLLIIKVHPHMENDPHFTNIRATYEQCPYLMFWDSSRDFYEIFDQIDLGIIDYSSIFYDMLAGGVPHFIRYFFDYADGENMRDMVFDLEEMTCGKICNSFDELIETLGNYESNETKDRDRINELFWQYSDKDTLERLIECTMEFEPDMEEELPTLYSFDIFDTLIARQALRPEGIFYYVREKMQKSEMEFPRYVIANYPDIRRQCEANVREYYAKTLGVRKSNRREITFDEIFVRMAEMYCLSDNQIESLKKWELEAEYENCIPRHEKIALAEELVSAGEKVFLISDMYLSKDFVKAMLKKVSPVLAELPLFLSSDYGVQKTTRQLFLEAYKTIENYNYKEWIHYGDNPHADGKCPRQLGIKAINHPTPSFNDYETALVEKVKTYDAYLIAAEWARFRENNSNIKEYFSFAYISMCFVPYICWTIDHALENGTQCLYFISRDGYHLKQIADVVIKERKLDLKTKYIYGSRRAWRIPSFIQDVDEEFFSEFGNFVNVNSYEKLLKAAVLTDEQFTEFFPGLEYVKMIKSFDAGTRKSIIKTLSASKEYREYILALAAEKREIVEAYFRQEIDVSEKIAFVEYWGRGYTQDCFARILQHVAGQEIDVPYYYARSIYPTQGHYIRYNFTTNNGSLIFAEAIFANIPYKSIEEYYYEGGVIKPRLLQADCDMELHEAMNKCLPLFTKKLLELNIMDVAKLQRELFDFELDYFQKNQDDEIFAKCLGGLIDSVAVYGEKQEFAPALTEEMLDQIEAGKKVGSCTRSLPITLNRSTPEMVERFTYLTEVLPAEKRQKKAEEDQKKKNERTRKQNNTADYFTLKELKKSAKSLQKLYDDAALKEPVEKKILFVDKVDSTDTDYAWSLKRIVEQHPDYSCEMLLIDENYEAYVEEMATAKCIIIPRWITLFTMLSLRSETKLIQVQMRAVPFTRRILYTYFDDMERNTRKLKMYRARNHVDVVTVSGSFLADDICRACSWDQALSQKWGMPITDVLFSEEFREEAVEKLNKLFPQAKGKKVILYMPQHRMRVGVANTLEMLNIPVLREALSQDYVMVYHNNAGDQTRAYHVADAYKDFICDLTEQMSVRSLMAAADVVVGDYRGEFFEAALTEKPMFMTMPDAEQYFEKREPLIPFEEFKFAPIIWDSYDLIERLKHLEDYDFGPQKDFARKYMEYCKGNAAEQIWEYILQNGER